MVSKCSPQFPKWQEMLPRKLGVISGSSLVQTSRTFCMGALRRLP